MCEFCVKHGEGKKWYLQMKNYSDVLLHEELSHSQKEIIDATTRVEAIARLFEDLILPAITGVSKPQDKTSGAKPATRRSEDEIVERRKTSDFGQVLPVEDVEQVIDIADSITRMPCGCRFVSTDKTDKR